MARIGVCPIAARPTGSTTGVNTSSPELDGKRQDILIEALPGLNHAWRFLSEFQHLRRAHLDVLREAARARNIEASIHSIAKPEEIGPAIDAAKAASITALNVLASPILNSNRHVIIARVAAQRLPAIFHWPETAEEGGFAAYGPRFDQIIRELHARQVAQILRGGKVADIPVEQPTKFELAINLHTATALGITVPSTLLARARTRGHRMMQAESDDDLERRFQSCASVSGPLMEAFELLAIMDIPHAFDLIRVSALKAQRAT